MPSQQQVQIAELMQRSGVAFGTSGVRGLAEAMTDRVCYAYTRAFMQHLIDIDAVPPAQEVAIAGDLRPSTPRIMAAVVRAVQDSGFEPLYCGSIPTPAVAYFGMRWGMASIMVTGSHIPDDRNGIKFNKPDGEILKRDEVAIQHLTVMLPSDTFDAAGAFIQPQRLPTESNEAYQAYLSRYLDVFPSEFLAGGRIGLYQHSSVAREILGDVLEGLGAEVVRLGISDRFVPVDTEAIRSEDVTLAAQWAKEHNFDAIVSADGDGDRPLISDENGNWLRGDIAGILCARFLEAQHVATPVSSNTAVDNCGWFSSVARTRIGSPYVIEAMDELVEQGGQGVVGYEANGGFLLADAIQMTGGVLAPLPTRDALIVILAVLGLARREQTTISGLLQRLPQRYTTSDRIKAFPTELSQRFIERFATGAFRTDCAAIEAVFGERFGKVKAIDRTDGLRITFTSDEIVHIRPSGNAPELRCYNEADSEAHAQEMNRQCMAILQQWKSLG